MEIWFENTDNSKFFLIESNSNLISAINNKQTQFDGKFISEDGKKTQLIINDEKFEVKKQEASNVLLVCEKDESNNRANIKSVQNLSLELKG